MRSIFTRVCLPLLLLFLCSVNRLSAQVLLEDFSYAAGTALTANGYTAISGAGTNAVSVTASGLSYPGSLSSGVGGAAAMTTSGEDVTRALSSAVTTGDAYASFLVNVSAAQAAGDYFFSLYDGGGFRARVWVRSSGAGFVFGVSKLSNTVDYEATVRTFGTTYLVVVKYSYLTGTTNDVVSFFVNPLQGSAEPAATITATSSTSATDAATIDRIALRQGTASAAPTLTIDGIRVGTTWASVTPVATPTTTSISPSSANAGSPGFILTVNGTAFAANSVVTWNGVSRTTTFISSTQLTASIPATDLTTPGTATIGVTTPGATASNTQNFTVNAVSGGTLTLTSPLADFGPVCVNTTAGPNSFTLDGANLDGSNGSTITIAALAGFSFSESAGGTFTSTLSFTYIGSSFSGKVIYVKFTPTAVQTYNGNIPVSGGGVTDYPVAAKGVGINSAPAVTTGSASAIAATTATVAGVLSSPGCAAVTEYGIEYSTASGFPDGSGTKVPASNLSGTAYSVNLTSLLPNTRYYYKAYATSSLGTTYGTQQAFNAAPLPVAMASQPGFTYTQDFSDIATWSNFFITGNGANHFGGLSSNTTAPSGLPDPNQLTTSTNSFSTGASGGVQKGNDQVPSTTSLVLLSTGATDNTSSAAVDFYMDFTGVNAGTLSFDYQTLNNSTGDRNGSLRVYGSVNGATWTEVTNVLNFTNNSPIGGSKTNIPLPAIFNNNANARLRFYYYNGTGGTTGSRPKISIDNLTVTAVATTPCTAPTAAPTALSFGAITDVSIQGSFTAASPAPDHYLVIASTNASLTSNPLDSSNYTLGESVGDGTVVFNGTGTAFTATGLSASTTYYFFVFSFNGVCTGGPLYLGSSLNGQATTAAGLPPCAAPAQQPTNLVFGTTTTNSIQGSFSAATGADEYLVLRSTSSSLSVNPVNGTAYNSGDAIGNATVVARGTSTSFTATSLSPNTPYYFFVFSVASQNCVNGPAYNIAAPLTGTQTTQPLPPCTTPTGQPSIFTFRSSNTAVSGVYNAGTGADAYLVVRSTSPTLSAEPADGTDYAAGSALGGGVVVMATGSNRFLATGLSAGTAYYFFVFAANRNCSGGTKYLRTAPLTGSASTTGVVTYNHYFGTWHAHSDYSDGNQDRPGYTPADDYAYAKTAQCMDYLGISEHNHFSSTNNPGNTVANYHLGTAQANTFTAANPGFLALYGMEWGVISGGGHVLVYGDGMDQLWGWESGSGGWGPTNNYDVYVPRSDYTGPNGLFRTVNVNIGTNTFASLAHPGFSDFNNLANLPYNGSADSAIVGTAVETGPATSTNTTYSNPGSSMANLLYYQTMLSKGYRLGPVIDHDNHNTTFGKTTYSRTAVVSPALTKTEMIKAMREMRFYATQDCDTKVDFTINTFPIGSRFTDRYAPAVSVNLSDATTSVSGAVIRLMYGAPGSGALPTALATVTGSSMSFTDESLANLATGYYYLDITNGTARIVTSPIWYTRNDNVSVVLPVRLERFDAQKSGNSVNLSWATGNEVNMKEYRVERSANGRDFGVIGKVGASGGSNGSAQYRFTDGQPVKGDNYYRLRSVEFGDRSELSRVVRINFEKPFTVTVSPNPASGFVLLSVTNRYKPLDVRIVDLNGKVVLTRRLSKQDTRIDVNELSKGLYVVRVSDGETTYTDKLILQ